MDEPDGVEGGGVGDVGAVFLGGAGFYSPGAVAWVEDAVGDGVCRSNRFDQSLARYCNSFFVVY